MKTKHHIEKLLKQYLDALPMGALREAMTYSTLNGGKRLRPTLVYFVGEALGAPTKSLNAPTCAIEFMHTFSLIHDDLPAMDNDDLRRGKPTCHKAFNEAIAILAGDALQTLSFEIIAQSLYLDDSQKSKMLAALASASGASGMGYGQSLDIQNSHECSLEQLNTVHNAKTGKLLEAAIKLGIIAANHQNQKNIEHLLAFGNTFGLAFQIQDDLLDVESTTEILGKPVGSDDKLDKMTYPYLLGIKEAKKEGQKLYQTAYSHLNQVDADTTKLSALLEQLNTRTY